MTFRCDKLGCSTQSLARNASAIILGLLLSICCGCNRGFPQSTIYKTTDLKSLISTNQPAVNLLFSDSEETCEEYATKEERTIIALQKPLQKKYFDTMSTACSNSIVGNQATVTGYELIGNEFHYPFDVRIRRAWKYETAQVVGQIQFDAVALDESRMEVSMKIFECRRYHW